MSELIELKLDKIIGGGQTLAMLPSGKKVFVWGGLPQEIVKIKITKNKANFAEGLVEDVVRASPQRVTPRDPNSFLATSPWQIMDFDSEQHYKAALVEEAFELHDIVLPNPIDVYSDQVFYEYRNKIEFSFWFDKLADELNLAFFKRGGRGKIAVNKTALAMPIITQESIKILSALNNMRASGRDLKTLLLRANQTGQISWQLYVKNNQFAFNKLLEQLPDSNGEVIFSDPKSPASIISQRLSPKVEKLSDRILGQNFYYATESFFQINLPVYEQAIKDIKKWLLPNLPIIDFYSGVGTIGLSLGAPDVTLVESNAAAVTEMKRNIKKISSSAQAILASSEEALDLIKVNQTVIVDPPRAGLSQKVIQKLLNAKPARIIYLSCNPVTQARDCRDLASVYGVRAHRAYNFFPRTPHIEHLLVLDKI